MTVKQSLERCPRFWMLAPEFGEDASSNDSHEPLWPVPKMGTRELRSRSCFGVPAAPQRHRRRFPHASERWIIAHGETVVPIFIDRGAPLYDFSRNCRR